MTLSRSVFGMLVTLPLTLAACAGAEEEEVEEAPAAAPMAEAAANSMRDGWVRSYMGKDFPGATVFYAQDAVFYAPDGTVATGKPAIEAKFAEMQAAGMDSLGIARESFEATGDEAVGRGTFVLRTLDPQTKEATYTQGGYAVTFMRQPDGTFQVVKDSMFATGEAQPAGGN